MNHQHIVCFLDEKMALFLMNISNHENHEIEEIYAPVQGTQVGVHEIFEQKHYLPVVLHFYSLCYVFGS